MIIMGAAAWKADMLDIRRGTIGGASPRWERQAYRGRVDIAVDNNPSGFDCRTSDTVKVTSPLTPTAGGAPGPHPPELAASPARRRHPGVTAPSTLPQTGHAMELRGRTGRPSRHPPAPVFSEGEHRWVGAAPIPPTSWDEVR